MSEATRPVGSELIGGIVDMTRRLALMETRFVRLAGNPVVLGDTTLTAAAASITFSDIPQNFSHLRLECYLRGGFAASALNFYLRFNGDIVTNYDNEYVYASVTSITAAEVLAAGNSSFVGVFPGATATANLFGTAVIDIKNYSQTANNKSYDSRWGSKSGTASGDLRTGMTSGFWRSSAAVISITLLPQGTTFAIGSRATLYGLP